jgi:hypothetical protein
MTWGLYAAYNSLKMASSRRLDLGCGDSRGEICIAYKIRPSGMLL